MGKLPNFANISFEEINAPSQEVSGENWKTPEGIEVKKSYSPSE